MKKTFLEYPALVLAGLVGLCANSRAYTVFETSIAGGISYFAIDATDGQFQVNVTDLRYTSQTLSAAIVVPSGTMPFSLGVGTAWVYSNGDGYLYPDPFLPPPPPRIGSGLEVMGVQYQGSFTASPNLLADLLAGHGLLGITALSGGFTLAQIVVVPEPAGLTLLLCGFLAWSRRKT